MSTAIHTLTDKIQELSPSQLTEVEDFVDLLRLRRRERSLTQATSSMSIPAFAAIWSNPDDDVYDAL